MIPLIIAGAGLGLLVSQLNNYTLAPVDEERISEAAGVNSAAGSFGLSFGLAMAGGIMLAALSISFTQMTENSTVIPPAQQEQIATVLEDDAEIMSNTQLDALITDEPPEVEAAVLEINDDARNLSLQVALAVPAARRAARARHLVPHDAPARPHPIGPPRRGGLRLMSPTRLHRRMKGRRDL